MLFQCQPYQQWEGMVGAVGKISSQLCRDLNIRAIFFSTEANLAFHPFKIGNEYQQPLEKTCNGLVSRPG